MVVKRMLQYLLPRGERTLAGLGLCAATVVAAACGALWWLAGYGEVQANLKARQRTVEVLASTLSQSIEVMLGAGELSAVRRLIADVARDGELSICRVTLGDGVLADADPAAITVQSLPPTGNPWPILNDQSNHHPRATRIALEIPGGGSAALYVAGEVEHSGSVQSRVSDGAGLIAACAVGLLGIVYHFGRRKARGASAICGALAAAEGDGASVPREKDLAALEVDDRYGPQAKAWNDLLRELVDLRTRQLAQRAIGAAGVTARRDDQVMTAFDALWHGLVIVDSSLKVQYANGAAAVFLSARRETLAGMDLLSLLSDPDVKAAFRVLGERSTSTRVVVEGSLSPGRDDTVFRLSGRLLRRDEGAGAMILIEDVTQQRVADKSRNAFVAQATHELRTPLTNIRLYVESLIDQPDALPATRSQSLNVINQEVRRLERLVGDMLSVSEIEAGTLKLTTDDVRLNVLFEELEADFHHQAQAKHIGLKFILPPKLPVIVGDRDKIVLALGNLVGNALKYTPANGEVSVSVRADADQVSVDVADNGIGIKDDEAELVFDRFYRSKDRRLEGVTGSGLGLALARQVVRLHGGEITLTSVLNKGSTFTMTLPMRAELPLAA